MKNNKLISNPLVVTALVGVFASMTLAHAQQFNNPFKYSASIEGGGVQGGGGDAKTELRITTIREDLRNWIERQDVASDLKVPSGLTYADYLNGNSAKKIFGMRDILAHGAVVIASVPRDKNHPSTNPEQNTYVQGQWKVCKSLITTATKRPLMICETEGFASLSESEQYIQIHHEYAGLGGLEKNIGAASDYQISFQLAGALNEQVVVRKLGSLRSATNSAFGQVRTSISGHKFVQVTDLPKLGNAWKDESGLIWGDVVMKSDGSLKMMSQYDARDYCRELSDSQHQYLLPTLAQFAQLARFLGEDTDGGYDPETIPGLKRWFLWTGSVVQHENFKAYLFDTKFGLKQYSDRDHMNAVRCVTR
jgi:hypothetical protein